MKNKKLIKRIAVASLACFLAIPTINTVPTQAETLVTVEMLQQEIEQEKKKIEDAKKNLEICKGLKSEKEQYNKTNNTTSGWENAIENYEIAIKDKQANINDIKNGVVMYRYTKEENEQKRKENQEKLVQQAAQKVAEQAEKDRIANTVYQIPAGVDNVYDFVPHFDDMEKVYNGSYYETHKYERTDMPGLVFTLRCGWNSSTNRYMVIDVNPHYSFSNFKSIRIKRYDKYGSSKIVNCYIKQFTYNYLSPFDAFGSLTSEYMQASIGEDPRLATYTGGIAGIKKGENSFAAHLFWKETDENGVATFDGNNGQLKGIGTAKTAEEFQNIINKYASRQCQPLTDRKSDELSGSIKNGQQLVEQWDAAGMDVIIEVTEE